MKRLWIAWIGLAFVLAVIYFLIPVSPESKLVLYNGTGLMAVLSVLAGIRIHKPATRAPWYWFAAGLTSFLTADICFYVLELLTPNGAPFPSIADAFYLMMYPMVIVGLTKMLRAIRAGNDWASFSDAAVVGMAMFGGLWVLFVDTVFEVDQHSTAALVTQLAYPVMDVALLTVAARLVVKVHLKHTPYALLLSAIVSLAIADTAYGIVNAQGQFSTGSPIDAFWLGFYVLFGAAALHPSMAKEDDVLSGNDGRLTGRALSLMFITTLSLPVIDLVWGLPHDRPVIIVLSAMIILLILLRIFSLMKALEHGRDRLHHEANHDMLTGLANRGLFSERTGQALQRADNHHVAVLFIDLDDFKTINDSLGHQAGDRMLNVVADRLISSVRPSDTVARLGGDEFAVLLAPVVDRNDVVSVCHRILDSMRDPVDLGLRAVQTKCSIGIAMSEPGEDDVDMLLRNADVAMYLSKRRGKARYEFFEAAMHAEAIERLDLKADLQEALAQNQLTLHYQPIFDLTTRRVTLTEALIRWRHPQRGLISPDRFIPLAEESGLIVDIGAWVLREACTQAAKWREIEGCEDLGVTVNLSVRQLRDANLLHTLTHALRESKLPASHLVLEITESMLADDAAMTTSILEQLKTVGVKLAIDDFGTGYSSLSYLRTFPVDCIKLDRSFITELNRSRTASALVEAVLNLAQALGAYTVAEGIELAEQASTLRRLGCDRAQGYHFCRPLPPATLTKLLREQYRDADPLAAWRTTSRLEQDRIYEPEVHRDLEEIARLAAEIDSFGRANGVPVMASWPWLSTWASCFRDWQPLLVAIRRRDTGQLSGYALLAAHERSAGTAVVAMGSGSSLCTRMPADREAAVALADAVAETLRDIPGVWSLDLEQLPDLDPTMLRLSESLDNVQVLPELRVPRVMFAGNQGLDMILSKSMRKQLRRAGNRITQDGLLLTIAFDRGAAISQELIDEVEAVHVSRDRSSRRTSDLDRPAEREFWRSVVEGVGGWEVEIASLRLDGCLAAYVVALLDRDVYRVYDGRMNSEFEDYSPGRLIESAALERALLDPRFGTLDWMSGVAAEKLLVSNVAEGRARLVATSGTRFLDGRSKRKDTTLATTVD